MSVLFYPTFAAGRIIDTGSGSLEPIRLQLGWHHQFQFAGYYAAKEQGFYQDAGFDVTLVAGSPSLKPLAEVLTGRAQFAVGNSEVLFSRLEGKPVVVVASIFQRSPSVLVSLASSGIDSLNDLVGKRVMTIGGGRAANLRAMFLRGGIDTKQVKFSDSSYQIQDLIDGKTDAFHAYLTNEPYYLEEKGVGYNIIDPEDYGISFSTDLLFTLAGTAAKSPERVERFREATLRGWEYALANSEEIVRVIHQLYNEKKSLNHLRFEALSVRSLIMPDLIEIGYINPTRMQNMANTFLDLGLVNNLDNFDGFIFVGSKKLPENVRFLIAVGVAVFVVLLLVAMVLALFNRRLQKEIGERKLAQELLGELVDTDPLTKLLNRRGFSKRYTEELMRAQRYSDVFSIILIDLDLFKKINDQYGHEAGDRVLVAVAGMLRDDTRESDFCGRFGGEEFILLLPKTSIVEATVYARRLCQHIGEMGIALRDGEKITITASAGVSEWIADDKNEATILRADKALYRAKRNGRNQVVTWDVNFDSDGYLE